MKWNRRIADLVRLGVLARDGADILVRPPKAWGRAQFVVMPPAPADVPF